MLLKGPTCYDQLGPVLEDDGAPGVAALADVDPRVLAPRPADEERAAALLVAAVHTAPVLAQPAQHQARCQVTHLPMYYLVVISSINTNINKH